ncbi:MAG TPA: hypothetical protein V6C72_13070, partial [Chroococcales cyanobacterium]
MNKIISSFLIAAAVSVAALPSVTMARQNPAVQPLFFEQLETATPAAQPAPISTSGAVTEVSWAGLAWELQNLKSSPVPLVIEFSSASQSDCVNWNPT